MKSRPDYLPPKALLEAGLVMNMNEAKHPDQKWRGMTPEDHVGAILRHVLSWLSGEKLDGETGKSHLTHALCRCAMAVEQELAAFQAVDFDAIEKQILDNAQATKERIVYDHLVKAPIPAPVNPEYEKWLDGQLKDDEFVEDPCPGEPAEEVRAKVGDWIEIVKDEGGAPVGALHKVLYSDNSHVDFKRGEGWCWASHDSYKIYHLPTAQPKAPDAEAKKKPAVAPFRSDPPSQAVKDFWKGDGWKEPPQGIDSIKPAQWDAANAAFLAEHQTRYANAINNQRKGDEE